MELYKISLSKADIQVLIESLDHYQFNVSPKIKGNSPIANNLKTLPKYLKKDFVNLIK